MASIMAGAPQSNRLSRPVDGRRSRPRPHATALDARVSNRGQALTPHTLHPADPALAIRPGGTTASTSSGGPPLPRDAPAATAGKPFSSMLRTDAWYLHPLADIKPLNPGQATDFGFLRRGQAPSLASWFLPAEPARALLRKHGAPTRVRTRTPLSRRRRGNRREAVFLGHGDYETYLHRLALYRARYGVTLHAYSLDAQPRPSVLGTAEAPLDRFIQCPQQSYTQRFNRQYGLVGHVFQGRYKALLCRDGRVPPHPRSIRPPESRAGRPGGTRGGLSLQRSPSVSPRRGHRARRSDLVLSLVGGTRGYLRLIASDTMGSETGAASPVAPAPTQTALAVALSLPGPRAPRGRRVPPWTGPGPHSKPGEGGSRLRPGPPPRISPDGRGGQR